MFSIFIKLFLIISVFITELKKEEIEDSSLLEAFKKGDRNAFGILFKKHAPSIYRFALYYTTDSGLAEDITQEAFVKTAVSLKKGTIIRNFKGFLYMVVRNKCIDYFNRQKKEKKLELDKVNLISHADPQLSYDNNVVNEAILKAISLLPETQKEAFILKEINGYKIRDIAKITGVNENTVKSRLRYALIILRKELKEFYHG